MSVRVTTMAANQFVIHTQDGTFFQSYNTLIAFKGFDYGEDGNVLLQEGYWNNYSATTNRYLNMFLRTDGIAEIRKCVESSEYVVVKDLGEYA